MSPAKQGFKEIRTSGGKLLGEIDPKRLLLRFKIKGNIELVDLKQYGIQEDQLKSDAGPLTNANVLFQ